MIIKLTVCMCVKNTAAHTAGVLSTDYVMSSKCSLIKVFELWLIVCGRRTCAGSELLPSNNTE